MGAGDDYDFAGEFLGQLVALHFAPPDVEGEGALGMRDFAASY